MANYTINRPNFLYSEEGLIVKTFGVDAVTNSTLVTSEVDSDGLTHSVIKAGMTVPFTTGSGSETTNVVYICYEDVDVTGTTADTQKEASFMVAGHYIMSKITTTGGTPTDGLIGHRATTTTRAFSDI